MQLVDRRGTPENAAPGNATLSKEAVALKAVFRLFDHWGIANDIQRALLGLESKSTFERYKRLEPKSLDRDKLERISYLLGIHKALRILFSNPENIYGWITSPNKAFGDQSPISRMAAGSIVDLAFVRAHLDYLRGGRG